MVSTLFAGGLKIAATLAILASAAVAADAPEPAPAASTPTIEPWGYPLSAIDRTVAPGDDFYAFANGGWLKATEIPADRAGVGFSTDMRDHNDNRIADVIADLAKASPARGTNQRRIHDLHSSFMNVARIQKRGLSPLKGDFARIEAASTHEDIARLLGDPALALPGPFEAHVEIDSRNPKAYAVWLVHSGLSLPDKSYYEKDDARLAEIRAAFNAQIAKMLTLAGYRGAAGADDVYALEAAIAALHWPAEERRDAVRTYNPMTRAELAALAPDFPFDAYLGAEGLGAAASVIVSEKDAFGPLAALFRATPVETWRAYLAYHLIENFAEVLPKEIDEAHFAFYGATLNGQAAQRAREKRAIELVDDALDQAVGEIYIERFFPPESKALVEAMVADFKSALGARIEALSWMTPETKEAALEKLAKMRAQVAYPERWRDYSGLEIRADDLVGNVKRVRAFDAQDRAQRLAAPVDKRRWFTAPQTVNAFYSPTRNEIFVPAGYIQSPLFDPKADPAVNYGALGSIIGHEIGHGFDDQGSKYNGDGALEDWWTNADRAAFDALGDRFAAQFDEYEPLPGLHVNGRLTLGENIGDLAGVVLAYHAYMNSLEGAPSPVLDGFTGAQRVFLGRAQARRYKQTDDALRRRLLSDPHSPMNLRVNGMVRNIDEWYEAFGVKPGEDMYLPPAERIRIW